MYDSEVMGGEYISDSLQYTVTNWPIARRLPTQTIILGDKRYVYVALNSEPDEEYMEFIFKKKWKYVKGTFNKLVYNITAY